jgi:hypothetical protein
MRRAILRSTAVLVAVLFSGAAALAGPKKGGGNRGDARTSVNRAGNKNTNKNVNVNQNKNVNRNTNVNVDRDVDIDVDVDHHHHGGYYGGGCCYHNPIATAAAVTATAMVIGSVVNTVPVGCVTTVINGMAYQQCGSTWYQPRYYGTSVSYVVVGHP